MLELSERLVLSDSSQLATAARRWTDAGVDLDQRPHHRALVGSLATFAEQIGTTIVAEGVERDEELRVLDDLGVPLAQGYGLARPGNPPPAVGWVPHARAV